MDATLSEREVTMVCGCTVLVVVAIPAAVSVWPAVVAAATAAASALGYTTLHAAVEEHARVRDKVHASATTEVHLPVSQGQAVTENLFAGQVIRFHSEGVDLHFGRNARGQVEVKVRGTGKTREELEQIGERFCRKLAQNYAYHRVMTKLRQQHFHIQDEHVEQDGAVHIQARIYRED
jgi:hypothetical protein